MKLKYIEGSMLGRGVYPLPYEYSVERIDYLVNTIGNHNKLIWTDLMRGTSELACINLSTKSIEFLDISYYAYGVVDD